MFGLGVFVGLSNPPAERGYGAAEFSAASRQVVLLGPLLAAVVALKVPTVVRFLATMRSVRRPAVALVNAYWPLLLAGPITGLLAMASVTRALPTDASSVGIAVVVFVTLLACGCLGLLIARLLNPIAGVPLSAALSFAWLALPGSGSNVLLRNLNSAFVGCCTPEQQPATAMLWGSFALTGLLALGTALALFGRSWPSWRRPVAALTIAAVMAVSAAGGVAAARAPSGPLTLLAIEPRQGDLACSADDSTEICLWPEHDARRADVAIAAHSMNAGLAALGLPPIRRFSEDPEDADAVQLTAFSYARPSDILFSSAQGLLTAGQTCQASGTGSDFSLALAFVALLVGLDVSDVEKRLPESTVNDAIAMRAKPTSVQRTYLLETIDSLTERCQG